jgi:hypothetical protein
MSRVAVSPVEGAVESATIPVNPLIGETLIVDVPVEPAIIVIVVGLAVKL